MTSQELARSRSRDDASARRQLEALLRVYPRLLAIDADGSLLHASPAFHELSGSRAAVGGDAQALLARHLTDAELKLAKQRMCRDGAVSAPMEVARADGATEVFELSLFPLVDPDTEAEASVYACVARDAQARRPIDTAAFACMPDPVVLLDADGFVVFANASAGGLFGWDARSLAGRPFAILIQPSDMEIGLGAIAEGATFSGLELQLRRRDGRNVVASVSRGLLASEPGERAVSVLVLRDVTEHARRNQELERINQELEHCVNALAHDLRSPLVAMLGFSRLLRQDYAGELDETGAHFLDRIEQAARTMEALIHDLLELSCIGRHDERRALIDPRGVLLQLHAELKPRLEASDIRLQLPDHPPLVFCDRTRLYQLFSNLVGNAIQHMGPCDDKRISIEVSEDADFHHIQVRDRGRGIDPEHHEHIFEVFRSLRTSPDAPRGAGIGLAIVKKIAETHGGRVWVESSTGDGATFHLTLPRVSA